MRIAEEWVGASGHSRRTHARVVLAGHGDHVVGQAHATSVVQSEAVPMPGTEMRMSGSDARVLRLADHATQHQTKAE